MFFGNTFYEIAAILGLAAVIGALGQKLRQPLIIMFLATGIVAGPACLGIIESHQQIELLAQIGIALLLFIVGLRLDLELIRTTGTVALATGLGQIVFTSVIGFFIALILGMSPINSAHVAVAPTFSSTIIIVKLLSDKREIDSLHGRIAVGFLIVQDIAAILALVGLTTFGSQLPEGESALAASAGIAAKGAGLLTGVGLAMKYFLPPLLRRMAKSQELLNVFAIAWAVLLGAVSDFLGCSKEVGAFLASVSLASTDYRDAIGARLTGLRDFLLLFFFIDPWSSTGLEHGRHADRGIDSVFGFCVDRQPDHRADHQGRDGIPAPHGFYGRANGRSDQRVLPDCGRPGAKPRSHHEGGHGPDYAGRSRHDLRLHLYDPLLGAALPLFFRAA
jgi:Kef-type K+ transport system membrane component KefB